mgnify:CR=1 FL=1
MAARLDIKKIGQLLQGRVFQSQGPTLVHLFFALSFGLFPSLAFAQTTYKLLAPMMGMTTVTLTDYLQGMVRVTIGVAGILAVVMIVICGIQMIGSPSVSQKSASKECITSAIFGLLLAIRSWVILNTINAQLLAKDVTIANLPAVPPAPPPQTNAEPMPTFPGFYYRFTDGPTARIVNSPRFAFAQECLSVLNSSPTRDRVVKTNGVDCFQIFAPTPGTPPPAPGAPPVAAPANEVAARNAICGNSSCIGSTPVGINNGPCTYVGQRGCTNVAGLPGNAIAAIKALPGPVVITGGTEGGHKTHFPGRPNFDLRMTPALNAYIKSNATQSATSFMRCRYLLNGFWYTDEVDHWHVCGNTEPQWYCTGNDKAGNPLPAGFYINCR